MPRGRASAPEFHRPSLPPIEPSALSSSARRRSARGLASLGVMESRAGLNPRAAYRMKHMELR